MRFWDSSAVLALLMDEPAREPAMILLEIDALMFAWWGTTLECVSAIARRERDQSITPEMASSAVDQLQALSREWIEVVPSDTLRSVAQRMLRVHALRGPESLQLAAAVVAAEREPSTLEFVGLDTRLNDAALREGFRVVVPQPR